MREIPGSLGRDARDAFEVRSLAIHDTYSNDGRIEMSIITYRGQNYSRVLVSKLIDRIASQHNGAITSEFPTGVRLSFLTLLDAVDFIKTCGIIGIAVIGIPDCKTALSANEPVFLSVTHLGYLIGADEMKLPI